MENAIANLSNSLQRKRIDFFEIVGKCNERGEISMRLKEALNYDNNLDFYVSC